MAELTSDQAIEALRKLPEDKQRLVIGKLTPDVRKGILSQLQGSSDLTANPKSEGLYRMLPSSGGDVTDTSKEIKVPYSQVGNAQGSGYKLHFDEESRYNKDLAHAPTPNPGMLERAGSAISGAVDTVGKAATSALQPSGGMTGEMPVGPGINLDEAKAAGRVVASTPEYIKSLYTAAKEMAAGRSDGSDLLNLLDPSKMPEGMYKQFAQDWAQDKNKAVNNLLGTIVGMGLVNKGTETVQENAISPSKTGPGLELLDKSRKGLQEKFGGGHDFVKNKIEEFRNENEKARAGIKAKDEISEAMRGAADDINAERGVVHGEKLDEHHEKINNLKVKHNEKTKKWEKKKADALKAHQDLVKQTQEENAKALQDHIAEVEKVAREEKEGRGIIDARQGLEKDITDKSAELNDRIQNAEKKAKIDVDNDWDVVRKKNLGQSTDITKLQQATERAADQADPMTSALFKRIIKGEQADLPALARTSSAVTYVDTAGNAIDRQAMSPARFDDMLAKGEIKSQPVSETVMPDDPGYGDLYQAQYGEPPPIGGGPGQFDRLQRWYSYATNKMYGGGRVESGLFNAYKMVRSAINDAMQDITQQTGSTGDLAKARKSHQEKMEAFSDNPNEPTTAASAYQREVTPEYTKEQGLLDKAKKLERYDPNIVTTGDAIRSARVRLSKLKSEDAARGMIKAAPQPPEPKSLPQAPTEEHYGAPPKPPDFPKEPKPPSVKPYPEPKGRPEVPEAEDFTPERRAELEKNIKKFGATGQWAWRLILGTAGEIGAGLIGGGNSAAVGRFGSGLIVGQGLMRLFSNIMRHDKILDWMANPSKEDIEIINTLPEYDAGRLRTAIKGLKMEEDKNAGAGTKEPNSLVKGVDKVADFVRPSTEAAQKGTTPKIAPQVAAFLAGGAATQSNNGKKKSLAELQEEAKKRDPRNAQ